MTENIQKSADTPLVRGHGLAPTEADEKRAISYIKRVKWRLNRKVSDHPFCYMNVTWNPELAVGFWFLAVMIRKYGVEEEWNGALYKHLYIERQKYWVVEPYEEGAAINRTGAIALGSSKALE